MTYDYDNDHGDISASKLPGGRVVTFDPGASGALASAAACDASQPAASKPGTSTATGVFARLVENPALSLPAERLAALATKQDSGSLRADHRLISLAPPDRPAYRFGLDGEGGWETVVSLRGSLRAWLARSTCSVCSGVPNQRLTGRRRPGRCGVYSAR